MRRFPLVLLALSIAAVLTYPALAQQTGGGNNFNIDWATLKTGDDWSAQVIQSLFPISADTTGAPSSGNEATAIGQVVGQLSGFVMAIACVWVCYSTLMTIHRAAESSRILGSGQSWIFVPRVGFAAILMFPLGNGFSAGQGLVYQGALWGIGMARLVYQNALTAIGPDGVVIAQPIVPGTQKIVLGLINDELCMALVNAATNTPDMVPVPAPTPGTYASGGGYITWNYSLSPGNQSGNPICGSVTVQTPAANQTTIAGVTVNMAAVQQTVLNDVLTGTIRPQIQTIAQNLWLTQSASALAPLQTLLLQATQNYTGELAAAAESTTQSINTALNNQVQQARNGTIDLLPGEQQASALGWTGAGAYYLELAEVNASTVSLMAGTPVVTQPSYDGLGPQLSHDLAVPEAAASDFMSSLSAMVQTQDPTTPPSGIPQNFSTPQNTPSPSMITHILEEMNLSQSLLDTLVGFITPTGTMWTDPFGGLMAMGQTLINVSVMALFTAATLAAASQAVGQSIFSSLVSATTGVSLTGAITAFMSFIATPLFIGILGLMIPGILIAYVLPMIPWALWMAGVCGWLILVCEAMVAVPLWMLAHMTFGGDGLHGRGGEGWGLLFNIVFRPTLMIIGLFLGYFIFACMSYLIRQTFGVAAGYALNNGWLVTNLIGVAVLLNIYVMMHITAALMAFRLVALMPHHLPRLIGFSAANRVDSEAFWTSGAHGPGSQGARGTLAALNEGAETFQNTLPPPPQRRISGPVESGASDGMDTTLRAITDMSEPMERRDD